MNFDHTPPHEFWSPFAHVYRIIIIIIKIIIIIIIIIIITQSTALEQ